MAGGIAEYWSESGNVIVDGRPLGGDLRGELVDLRHLTEAGLEEARKVVRLGQLLAPRLHDVDIDRVLLIAPAAPDHAAVHVLVEQVPGQAQRHQGDGHRDPRPLQRKADQTAVDAAVERRARVRPRAVQSGWASENARGEGRDEGEGHGHAGEQADPDDEGERQVVDAQFALEVHERDEHYDRRSGGGQHRQQDLAGAVRCGIDRSLSRHAFPVGVLEHNDRVVYDQPEPHRQAHQCQQVQREPREVHHVDRDENGEADGGEDDAGGAEGLEEQDQHEEHDRGGNERACAEIAQLLPDVLALVVVEQDACARRMRVLHLRQPFLDLVGGGDGV